MLLDLLRRYARPYRGPIAIVAVFQVVSTLASLYLPTINAAIIDDGVAKGDTERIVELGVTMLGVTGLQVVCAVAAVYFGSRVGMGFGRDLRSAMFHHVTGLSAEETARFGAPTLLTRTTNDVQQIQVLLQMTCTMLITAPIMCVGGIAMAIHQNAGLSWLLLVSVPLLALSNYWIVTRLLPIFRSMQRLIDGINRVMREQLAGIRVVRAFAREPLERARFAEANQALSDTALTVGRWQAIMLPITTLVINVSSVALIWFGGMRIDSGEMQVGSLIAFLSYFMQILMAVLMVTVLLVMLPRASVCAERITEVLVTVPAIVSPEHPRRSAVVAGEIRFEEATFSYPRADRPVLQGISLTARPGTTTAVVGSTGSGKSTLISLICRLFDVTGGSVTVDGIDVREHDVEALWSTIGLVPQRGYLFSGTVADNLRIGKAEATDGEMWEALRVASADTFVSAHPEGLQMPVAQGGINFSGGQRQRLAIARAVIRRPAIYLFDDAFSALDVHTDAHVRAALAEVSAESTVVVVSQRISTVIAADQIVVIDDGTVVGIGTHEALLAECPVYMEFAESQALTVGGRPVTGPMGRRMNAGLDAPVERSRDFRGSAIRLVKRLTPQRAATVTVLLLGIAGIALSVVGPLILGHATDLLFDGVIGRELPAGLTKEQAVEAARARGDGSFADLLSGMNVVPGQGVDFDAVGRTLLLALVLYLIAALLVWMQARLLNVAIQRTMVKLRSDVEDKVHRLPLGYFDARQRGEVLSRVTNDVDNIQSSLTMTISQLVTSALTVVAVLVMMLVISPLLAFITVLTVPLSLWATRTIARRSRTLFIAQWRNTGRLNAHVEETYSGFNVVKTFGHRALAEDKFRELNRDVYDAGFGAQFLSGLVSPATTFVGNLSYVAVAVVGGLQVATGQITLGNIQAFIQYVRQFNQPLTQVAGMYNTLQSGIASAERVFELLDADEQIPDQPSAAIERRGPGRVEFDHVDFEYRPGTPVIEDLSLVAEPGSTVAIVGPTGAGKTTLVNLLMRFYEVDSGRILIDGVDITTMSRHALRSSIGMVLQDTWLFGGTIYDNIAYGRPDADDAEIVAAARAAHVDRFVHTLPDGYQTRITDDGGNISAGEKQLITIARAVLAQPRLLILDEATSSVDTRTELLIQQATAELRRDRTSFIIAHRLSTIRDADVILVMEAGRIVERGSHDELVARHGEYWSMTQA